MIAALPGVYRPRVDSALLVEALRTEPIDGASVLELCAGTGYVGLSVAPRCSCVVVSDISRRAAASASLNSAWHRARLDVRRGDLLAAVPGERFDVIIANPPYLPSAVGRSRRSARAWNGGIDGRDVTRRICATAPRHLTGDGTLYLVGSSLSGIDGVTDELGRAGFPDVQEIAEHRGALGPIARRRIGHLRAIGGDVEEERHVVLRARRQGPASRVTS